MRAGQNIFEEGTGVEKVDENKADINNVEGTISSQSDSIVSFEHKYSEIFRFQYFCSEVNLWKNFKEILVWNAAACSEHVHMGSLSNLLDNFKY